MNKYSSYLSLTLIGSISNLYRHGDHDHSQIRPKLTFLNSKTGRRITSKWGKVTFRTCFIVWYSKKIWIVFLRTASKYNVAFHTSPSLTKSLTTELIPQQPFWNQTLEVYATSLSLPVSISGWFWSFWSSPFPSNRVDIVWKRSIRIFISRTFDLLVVVVLMDLRIYTLFGVFYVITKKSRRMKSKESWQHTIIGKNSFTSHFSDDSTRKRRNKIMQHWSSHFE